MTMDESGDKTDLDLLLVSSVDVYTSQSSTKVLVGLSCRGSGPLTRVTPLAPALSFSVIICHMKTTAM